MTKNADVKLLRVAESTKNKYVMPVSPPELSG